MWRYLWTTYDWVEQWLALLFLGATSLSMLLSATMRALGMPFTGGAELAQLLFIWTAVLGADITLRRGGQVRVDALVSVMPRPVVLVLTGVCLVLMLGFLGLLVWHGVPLALNNWQRPMGVGSLSYGYVTLALPVGAALMFITLIRRIAAKGVAQALSPDQDVPAVEEVL